MPLEAIETFTLVLHPKRKYSARLTSRDSVEVDGLTTEPERLEDLLSEDGEQLFS